MRGKGLRATVYQIGDGITPAYAGKSSGQLPSWGSAAGSPPPMRGKVKVSFHRTCVNGITPAYAGKRTLQAEPPAEWQDHPRLCGEKYSKKAAAKAGIGSPPPMRGKAYSIFEPSILFRITPAYAGKSLRLSCGKRSQWDHPRLCGEKIYTKTSTNNNKGSPPPMRGKDNKIPLTITQTRITPAYAGKRRNDLNLH